MLSIRDQKLVLNATILDLTSAKGEKAKQMSREKRGAYARLVFAMGGGSSDRPGAVVCVVCEDLCSSVKGSVWTTLCVSR